MKIIGVIPARWASSRFPGKVLADLCGKPMIQHVWEQAKKSRRLHDVIIACDEQRVFAAVKRFGARPVLTSPALPSGTDRIAAAVKNLAVDVVVNIQGDEPLVEPKLIDALTESLLRYPSYPMATVIRQLQRPADLENPNVVKVVVDVHGDALYFSRSLIPFNRDGLDFKRTIYYKHLGLYAYRKKFLLNFKKLPPSTLEKTERLEQLRVVQAGFRIKTVLTRYDTIGVDTKEDLVRVARLIASKKRN